MSDIRHFLQKKRKIESSPSTSFSINESSRDTGNLSTNSSIDNISANKKKCRNSFIS